jgi:hypothetical protein
MGFDLGTTLVQRRMRARTSAAAPGHGCFEYLQS